MSVHQKKDGRWYCKYYVNGKEKNQYFGRGDIAERQAIQFDEQVKLDRGKGSRGITLLTVAHILDQYHNDHYAEATTKDSDFYRIDRTISPVLGKIPAEQLTHAHLDKYLNLRLKHVKLKTIDRELDVLRSAYNWAARQDPPLIMRNPLATYKVPRDKSTGTPSPPMMEEITKILEYAPQHLIRAVFIMWHCGLRPGGEITRLSWLDFNYDAKEIRVVGARKGGPIVRYVPVTAQFAEMLKAWKEADAIWLAMPRRTDKFLQMNLAELPIVHYRGKRVGLFRKSWDKAKADAKVTRRMRLYDIRHAWFTNALREGADLKATSETGGHSRVDTTLLVYQHVTKQQHRDVAEKIPALPWPLKATTKPDFSSKTIK